MKTTVINAAKTWSLSKLQFSCLKFRDASSISPQCSWSLLSAMFGFYCPHLEFLEVFLVFGTMNARKRITLSTKTLLWFSWKALHDPTSIITPPSLPGWPCVKNLHVRHFHFLPSSPPALTTSLGASCRTAIPTLAAGQEAAAQALSPSPRRLSWNLQGFNVSLMMMKKYPPLPTDVFKSTGGFPWSWSTVLTRFMRTDTSFGGATEKLGKICFLGRVKEVYCHRFQLKFSRIIETVT